ncbi:hypothetical protein AAG570_010112 [Ranatra chinensis]|uniref:Uncharacterized protein n=1 Tax=Ranatra chinensis TaxID=642074 RepID=A0ABD0YLK9_9HEMI
MTALSEVDTRSLQGRQLVHAGSEMVRSFAQWTKTLSFPARLSPAKSSDASASPPAKDDTAAANPPSTPDDSFAFMARKHRRATSPRSLTMDQWMHSCRLVVGGKLPGFEM